MGNDTDRGQRTCLPAIPTPFRPSRSSRILTHPLLLTLLLTHPHPPGTPSPISSTRSSGHSPISASSPRRGRAVRHGPARPRPTSPANHAGYDHAATTLLGFSHTRGVGVGCGGAGGDLMIALRYAGSDAAPAQIDKTRERARAGTYSVRYDGGILAETTATRGGGVLRFTVPRAGTLDLRIDPRRSYAKRLSANWARLDSDDLRADLVAGHRLRPGRLSPPHRQPDPGQRSPRCIAGRCRHR
ncbi:hypothetical protein QP185_00435 [Sphingomonas aerolata]|uniref:hypothetical protein n=1 Tax=Sphingomonas aerolata TaxID=185951 RepID=UPI002FE3CBCE